MKTKLTDFDLGRLYERRELRDFLIIIVDLKDDEFVQMIRAWLENLEEL